MAAIVVGAVGLLALVAVLLVLFLLVLPDDDENQTAGGDESSETTDSASDPSTGPTDDVSTTPTDPTTGPTSGTTAGVPADAVDVAEEVLEASADLDFEGLCELASAEKRKEFFQATPGTSDCAAYDAEVRKQLDGIGFDVADYEQNAELAWEITESRVVGSEVEVDYEATLTYSGTDQEIKDIVKSSGDIEGTMTLVEEGGEWKLDDDTGGLL